MSAIACISVKWNGKEYKISDLHEDGTVLDLKKAIAVQTNVLPERQKLLGLKYKGKLSDIRVKHQFFHPTVERVAFMVHKYLLKVLDKIFLMIGLCNFIFQRWLNVTKLNRTNNGFKLQISKEHCLYKMLLTVIILCRQF